MFFKKKKITYFPKSAAISAWQFTRKNFRKGAPDFVRESGVELWSQYGGEVIGGRFEGFDISEGYWIVKHKEGISIHSKNEFEMHFAKVKGEL